MLVTSQLKKKKLLLKNKGQLLEISPIRAEKEKLKGVFSAKDRLS